MSVELIALQTVPLVAPGDDLAELLLEALGRERIVLADGDIVVIAQKIVSKSQGRYVHLGSIEPSAQAQDLAARARKDPRLVELVLRQSRRVVRCAPNVLIVETVDGLILANAGIDRSNVDQDGEYERVLLLPVDPDGVCRTLRQALHARSGADVGVIVNDSFGRPWRLGTVGTAIGASGVAALRDRRGASDLFGFRLQVTQIAIADEVAAAASLLMGQADEARPVVVVRGLAAAGDGCAGELIRPGHEDLFR